MTVIIRYSASMKVKGDSLLPSRMLFLLVNLFQPLPCLLLYR